MLRSIGRVFFKLIPEWSWRLAFYGSVATLIVVGGVVLGLRYWLLPNIESYRGDIESALTRAVGQRVTIGSISADWDGLRPQMSLAKVTVFDKAGAPALELERVNNTLSWLSLVFLELRFYALEIDGPELSVRRAKDGTLFVAGIEMKQSTQGGGLADWLLRQREILIRDATIAWTDEQRDSPQLVLSRVMFRLQNDLHRHKFGLTAIAPPELAGPLDVRGDLVGGSVRAAKQWQGQVFMQLDYADLARWSVWVPMPIAVAQGRGALRTWVDIANERVTGVIADVRLADVNARLAADLDPLVLGELNGRIAWRDWSSGFEFTARGLVASGTDGRRIQPGDFYLRRDLARDGKAGRGEMRASALDLYGITQIARHVPLDADVLAALVRYAPRGTVEEMSGKWSGDWPPRSFEVRAKVRDLSANAVERFPGFTNLSGTLDANEKRGTLTLANRDMSLELPGVFAGPLVFDNLAGQIGWSAAGQSYDIRLADITFANGDAAGSLQGSVKTAEDGKTSVDLTGALTRADARRVARYLPLAIRKSTRDWLESALVAGQSNDVRLRLRGDLAEFPFDQPGNKGIFEIKAKATGGVVEYAAGWPRIENISADLLLTANRMEVRAATASILGTQLTRAVATIADLNHADEILEVGGEAEGPTTEFLRFIAESPVTGMIDRFTEGMEAQGRGRLDVKLTIPLRAISTTRVAGNYQFNANRLRFDADMPALEQVNGRLEFTNSGVRAQGVAAQVFGGAATINLATQDGSVAVTAAGRANVDALRKGMDIPALQYVSGTTDWRSSLTVRAKQVDFVIESGMRGIVSTLPPPLDKAADDAVPLHFERRISGSQQDQLRLSYGDVLIATATRQRDAQRSTFERAAIGLGSEPPSADGPGIWVRGSLATLDLDRWRAVFGQPTGRAGLLPNLASLDLKAGTLEVFGRRFQNVVINAREQAGNWNGRIASREMTGEIGWRSQGKGQVIARMQRLSMPASLERADVGAATPTEERPVEYPALDVVVEDFSYKGRAFGRLELIAVPDGRDWKIERLDIRNPAGRLVADGMWHWQSRAPRTQLNGRLDVADIGKFLTRFGYPEGIRGGTATLIGTMSWAGPPQDLDFPTLAGNVSIEAGRGQFAKLDPGIGKLLSILSLQALPRRVALDFKDVFSDGFAFDEILGTLKLQRGVANTENFRINGSSAKVVMNGDIDLVQETQKLRVRVTPSVGDTVATVTALIGGPVAGIGVFLAQKLLKDPLGQIVAYDYAVTGTWGDPQVTRLGIDRAQEPG